MDSKTYKSILEQLMLNDVKGAQKSFTKDVEKPPKKLRPEALSYYHCQAGLLHANIMSCNGDIGKSMETAQAALEKWSNDPVSAKVDADTI